MTVDYKATLNLPKTEFKMKAGAATREPELEAFWESEQIYEKLLASRDKSHRFLLHDGPPYLSSGNIHIGTALNKILKDIITRYKTQRGYYAPYVPGYDGHGLPIENAVVKSIPGGRSKISELELRRKCRTFALDNLKGQEAHFKRLGVWGDWENPYVTISADYEATQIRVFWRIYEKGYVYKGLKPVYWCPHCETALADAEVEYADHTSHSIYVRFAAAGEKIPENLPDTIKALWSQTAFVIWTTTPWTLPANLGLALNAELTYDFVQTQSHGVLIIGHDLLDSVAGAIGLESYEVLYQVQGSALENLEARHPLYDRTSRTILGDHVTADAGTGIVHTAPGHGHEDYLVGQQYDLGILSPVNGKGVFTDEAGPQFAGLFYEKGSVAVIEALKEVNALLGQSKFNHSYPHCWRCHNPVIYRATPQWFINVEAFRGQTLDEIKEVQWIPARGEARITSMVANRSDWCISRQRVWGVPIPVFYCKACDEPLINAKTIEAIATRFENETSDAWWAHDAQTLLGSQFTCTHCGNNEFMAETDIMDVWFDSGVSHTAVVEKRADQLGPLPVELYLEGSDQHRGWFQSSLLTSVAIRDMRPFNAVLTHGFVLDPNGRKMSKSLGNVVDPTQVISQLGADVLRLWAASVDYGNDVRLGKENLNQLAEVYRKVRNTLRFILGNLNGFDASRDCVPYNQLSPLDQYVLHQLQQVISQVTEAFDQFAFHQYYQVLQNFCVTQLSALYFDVTKDILYTLAPRDLRRRAVQTVLFELLSTLTPMLVPVMPHLAEDIWQNTPLIHRPCFGESEPPLSILMSPWPALNAAYLNPKNEGQMAVLLDLKNAVNLVLETPRANGQIGSSLETKIILQPATEVAQEALDAAGVLELATLFIVSEVEIVTWASKPSAQDWLIQQEATADRPVAITVYKTTHQKCIRCWKFLPSVGQHQDHPELCTPCVAAVNEYSALVSNS